MKKINQNILMISALLVVGFFEMNERVSAEAAPTNLNQKGKLTVEDSGETDIVDPEDPDEVVDPTGPSTKGALRIDYVSRLDFGKVKLSDKNRTFYALASDIGKSKKVGSFIQISDFRKKSTGWTLQVKQETQFVTSDHDELTGAVLSLDKGWANSVGTSGAPEVTRDTLSINNIGTVYDVAKAKKSSGTGIWSISFGASKENDDNQPVTIQNGDDSQTGIRNSAVGLTIPSSTKVLPKEYQTRITWILAATP